MVRVTPTNLAPKRALGGGAALAKATRGERTLYVRREEVAAAVAAWPERTPNAWGGFRRYKGDAERERAWIRFLWLTGARISEARAALVSDVDFGAKVVNLRTLKRRRDERRAVPLPAEFIGELGVMCGRLRLARDAPLWPWQNRRAYGIVRGALLLAGVEPERAHPHALRHGHAMNALAGGAGINDVQIVLGHSSLMTTTRYTRASAEDIKRSYSRVEW